MSTAEQIEDAKIDSIGLTHDVDEKWVEHLSAVHNVEFNLLSVAISVTTSATPIVLGFLYSLPTSCAVGVKSTQENPCIDQTAYVALPLAPLSLVLFYCYLFLNSRVVGKYGRELERSVAENSAMKISAPTSGEQVVDRELKPSQGARQLAFPALSRLNGALYGGESRRLLPFRFIFVTFAVVVVVVEIISIFFLVHRIRDEPLQTAAYWIYALLVAACTMAFLLGGSHGAWDDLKTAVIRRDALKDDNYVRFVPWPVYVRDAFLPRPLSNLKGLDGFYVVIAASFLGYVADVRTGLRAALGLFFFQVVLYQTRYLLNGVRDTPLGTFGLAADRRSNPELPMSPVQRLMVPLIAIGRACGFVFVMGCTGVLDERESWVVVALFLAVFYLYEIPREVARGRLHRIIGESTTDNATGDQIRNVVLARARTTLRGSSTEVLGWALFVAVGGGYALRAGLALYLLNTDLLHRWQGVLVVVIFWLLGSMQVSAGWVAEFMGALSKPGHGPQRVSVGLLAKPHLLWAARRCRGLVPDLLDVGEVAAADSREESRFTGWGTREDLVAPWSLAFLLACGGALSLGWDGTTIGALAVLAALPLLIVVWFGPIRTIVDDWCKKPWYALVLKCSHALVALGLAAVATRIATWREVLGVAVLVFVAQWKLGDAQSAQLSALIKAALRAWTRVGSALEKVAGVVIRLLELVFGYQVVHAFAQRFSYRRKGWL